MLKLIVAGLATLALHGSGAVHRYWWPARANCVVTGAPYTKGGKGPPAVVTVRCTVDPAHWGTKPPPPFKI